MPEQPQKRPARPHRITHLGVCVRDLERSVSFYTEALGFSEVERLRVSGSETETILEVPGAVVDLVYLERDGLRIELLGYLAGAGGTAAPRRMDHLGFTHLSVRVDSLDDLTGLIIDCGGEILRHTQVTFAAGNRGVMAVDPDGIRIELIERRSR